VNTNFFNYLVEFFTKVVNLKLLGNRKGLPRRFDLEGEPDRGNFFNFLNHYAHNNNLNN